MNEEPVIHVENISKSYKISHQQQAGYGTLKDDFAALFKKSFTKNEDDQKETFWALKDISFDVKKGEVFGIVGKNGSGKSTLLKILSRTVDPTEGKIVMHGRVASMLEVGTGFHPELTGRENVFFNGSMLGMGRSEIEQKFDEIVAFSEIEKFLDTPVKFYSSGMYVRLAFAVAAHLEPDVLIIDEVLAVGDASFQKKCMSRISSIARSGRTVLFVSHSMTVVKQLCDRAMFLEKGKAKYIGETEFATEQYMARNMPAVAETHFEENPKKAAQIRDIQIQNGEGEKVEALDLDESWQLQLKYTVKEPLEHSVVAVEVLSNEGQAIFMTSDSDYRRSTQTLEPGTYRAVIPFSHFHLVPGVFYIRVSIQAPGKQLHDMRENIPLKIRQNTKDVRSTYFGGKYMGYIANKVEWHVTKKEV